MDQKISKHYYKATIQYDGTGYIGFQWQEGLRTIQGDLLVALKSIGGPTTTLRASSRTDTGVHALGQVIRIASENPLDYHRTPDLLNEILSPQIRCLEVSPCEHTFKPATHCTSKEYRYLFSNTPGESGEKQRYIANNPYPLNLELMKKCADMIVGEHNFQNFVSLGNNDRSPVRKIFSCEFTSIDPREFFKGSPLFSVDMESCYQLRVEGSGFMKHMIRHLIAALWMVGNGRLGADRFEQLLKGNERTRPIWKLASPKGLYLYHIRF